jgi:lipoprotein-releasing system permease protein
LNFPLFISQRLRVQPEKNFSAVVNRIGVGSIALGLAVMLVAFAILGGYRQAIIDKIVSLNGHFVVDQFETNNAYEKTPVSTRNRLFQNYKTLIPQIKSMEPVAAKPGLLKTDEEMLGVIFKGIDARFDTSRFAPQLRAGNFLQFPKDSGFTNQVLVSQTVANQLRLQVGAEVLLYFIQSPPKVRKLIVRGIYETDMDEFDKTLIIGDLALLRNLNKWADTLTGGFEIYLNRFEDLDVVETRLEELRDYDLMSEKVTDRFASVFDWLNLLNRNVYIFLGLILVVASFNMISILFILILERTQMIGLLKALGATTAQLRGVFLWNALWLIVNGLAWGNAIGLGFCAVQYYFHLIPLERSNYYMDTVPIRFEWGIFALLNLGITAVVLAVLILPTLLLSRMQPVRSIRFA